MGGSDPQPAQVIQAPPAPSVEETSRQAFQSQLEFNPQLTQQAYELQAQYAPQFAQTQLGVAQQTAPQYRALLESQYPQIGPLSNQVTQQLLNPSGYSVQQQAALDALRGRARGQVQQNVRESANLGGTLFSGNRQLSENRALGELEQGFVTEDLNRQLAQRQQTLSELATLFQIAGLPVQQAQVPNYTQGVVPGGDSLYNALVQNQGNFGVIQGQPGQASLAGPAIGAGGSIIAAKIFVACLPGNTLIDTEDGSVAVKDIKSGDRLVDGSVSMKNEYAPAETIFVKLIFDDGTSVETCDAHMVSGRMAFHYQIGDKIGEKVVADKSIRIAVETTYDILSTKLDGGYQVAGIPVASMIPTMHKLARVLEEVA